MDDPFARERVRAAYDAVAADYAVAFRDDLTRLPLDLGMLDKAHRAAGGGVLLDLGCGTGSVGAYLTEQGARVVGVDLSFGMLASGLSGDQLPRCQGDMRELPFGNESFTVVVAYYSVQHVRRTELGAVLGEVSRVLRPSGALLLSTHLGEGELYMEEFLGHHVAPTGGTLYSPQEITDQVSAHGFVVEASARRAPLDHEHQSQRIYLLARWAG